MTPIDGIFLSNGKVICTRKALESLLRVTKQAIVNYESPTRYPTPLKRENSDVHNPGGKKLIYYDLMYALQWHKDNVDKSQNHAVKAGMSVGLPEDDDSPDLIKFLQKLPKHKRAIWEASKLDPMDKLLKLRDDEKKEIENKIKRGEYVHADNHDKDCASLSGLMMGSFYNYEMAASSELKPISGGDTRTIIQSAHFDVTNTLDKIIKKEFECDETAYEVFGAVVTNLGNGVQPDELVRRVNGSV